MRGGDRSPRYLPFTRPLPATYDVTRIYEQAYYCLTYTTKTVVLERFRGRIAGRLRSIRCRESHLGTPSETV